MQLGKKDKSLELSIRPYFIVYIHTNFIIHIFLFFFSFPYNHYLLLFIICTAPILLSLFTHFFSCFLYSLYIYISLKFFHIHLYCEQYLNFVALLLLSLDYACTYRLSVTKKRLFIIINLVLRML